MRIGISKSDRFQMDLAEALRMEEQEMREEEKELNSLLEDENNFWFDSDGEMQFPERPEPFLWDWEEELYAEANARNVAEAYLRGRGW